MCGGAAHAGDVRAEVLAQLHRRGADGAGRSDDEQPRPGRDLAVVAQERERGQPTLGDGDGVDPVDRVRHLGDAVRRYDDELGVPAGTDAGGGDHASTESDVVDPLPQLDDLAGEPRAEHGGARRRRPVARRAIGGSAARMAASAALTATAAIRTSTSPGPGVGRGTRTSRRTSGGP